LKKLNCSYCPGITEIPNISGLKELYCSGCSGITEIPNIDGLKILDCFNCSGITEIPNISGLKKLNCFNCSHITEIPNISGLKELDCSNCSSLIFCPDIAINQVGLEIVKKNLHNYRLKQSREFIHTILKELIKATWEPNRAKEWCWDTEEKKFLFGEN
jgi:Leucine-rich repeat (LRR) protein